MPNRSPSVSSFLCKMKLVPGFLRARALALLLKFLILLVASLSLRSLVLEVLIVGEPLREMDQSFVFILRSIVIDLETEVSSSILPACLRTKLTFFISDVSQRTRPLNPIGFLMKTSRRCSRVRGRIKINSSSVIAT